MDEFLTVESRGFERHGNWRFEVRVRYEQATDQWLASVTVFDARERAFEIKPSPTGTSRGAAHRNGQAAARAYIDAHR